MELITFRKKKKEKKKGVLFLQTLPGSKKLSAIFLRL